MYYPGSNFAQPYGNCTPRQRPTIYVLNEHLQASVLACNHAKQTLRGLTPPGFGCAQWPNNPPVFTQDPPRLSLGLYS